MSTLDENGILQYEESDARDTFSELLNMGQGATSDAISADRGRLAALETLTTPGGLEAPCDAAAGFSLQVNTAIRLGKLMFYRISWTRTGSAITVQPDGNIPDTAIATFKAGFVPVAGMLFPASSVAPVASYFASNTGVWVSAVAPGSTFPTNTTGQFAGLAILA
ncbi:hypothetical protein [Microbacterium paludicola]|uniref:hypothetical protein n=1 Tax=Microbacterium paludicola TaxID=300019 RepID=UPI0011A22766|nr:hypothetical protein [Microbacterium paludicola]